MDSLSAINSIIPAAAPDSGAGVPASGTRGGAAQVPLQFHIEQVNDRVVVSVINGSTGEVVQRISSEVWLRVASMLTGTPKSTFGATA